MRDELISALKAPHVGVGDVVGAAAVDRAPHQVADLADEPASPVVDVLRQAGYRAALVVPLNGVADVIGALVMWRKEPGAFSDQVVELLQTFGAQSVQAIQNARLHDRVTAQAADLAGWNRTLEQRVADQLLEIERVGRLQEIPLAAGGASGLGNWR